MIDKEKKSKVFVIILSIMVIVLIVIGCVFTWNIIQAGIENSGARIQEELTPFVVNIT